MYFIVVAITTGISTNYGINFSIKPDSYACKSWWLKSLANNIPLMLVICVNNCNNVKAIITIYNRYI